MVCTPRRAFRTIAGRGRVYVFAVHVLCLGDKGATTVAAASVALFEAEELDLLLEEVDESHRRDGAG